MQMSGWALVQDQAPLERIERAMPALGAADVLVEVVACGVCHTDLGYMFDGVPLRGARPRILGHEIAGVVRQVGAAARPWLGRAVVIPAVVPCGTCSPCERQKPGICRQQIFVGNDVDGGFASHVVVRAQGLCEVPQTLASRLAELAVVADAVTTPYNAVLRSELGPGDVAIFVGAGGIGAFGVQIARARGAHVLAVDVDAERLELIANHGASAVLNAQSLAPGDVRKEIRGIAKRHHWPDAEWRIFETSGTRAGQETAFSLLNFGATLMVVGYATSDVQVRLSNLMAYEARALGVWGCPPQHYADVLALVAQNQVVIAPFIDMHPMSQINDLAHALHQRRLRKRVVLRPDF